MLRLLEGHEYGGQVRCCLKYYANIVSNISRGSAHMFGKYCHKYHPLVHQSIGRLVDWSIGPLVHWSIGPLVLWLNVKCHKSYIVWHMSYVKCQISNFKCQMLNVNNVKLLSERTSGHFLWGVVKLQTLQHRGHDVSFDLVPHSIVRLFKFVKVSGSLKQIDYLIVHEH